MASKQDNIRYNILVINEIISYFKKRRSFNVLSENIRERYFVQGQFEESKIDLLCNETGIERACFTGGKRFLIPKCEDKIVNNPNAFTGINNSNDLRNIPNIQDFETNMEEMLKAFERKEFIEDENLERMMYYISKCGSMEGYSRMDKDLENAGLNRVCRLLEGMDNDKLMEADAGTIKRFIEIAEEKIVICKAGLIKNKGKNGSINKKP